MPPSSVACPSAPLGARANTRRFVNFLQLLGRTRIDRGEIHRALAQPRLNGTFSRRQTLTIVQHQTLPRSAQQTCVGRDAVGVHTRCCQRSSISADKTIGRHLVTKTPQRLSHMGILPHVSVSATAAAIVSRPVRGRHVMRQMPLRELFRPTLRPGMIPMPVLK